MKDLTRCVVNPPVPAEGFDSLAVPVHRGSTIRFATSREYQSRGERGHAGYSYGLYGTPTTRTLEAKLTALEHGAWTVLLPSGQAANSFAMLPFLSAGDRVLIADSAYPPVRDFADRDLARLGIEAGYYDPTDVADLERRIDGRTRLVWCESPGSTTMEVQDLPAIAAVARRHGALVGCDNSWATPLNFKPLDHGADLVTEALTKYVGGHSDLLMGSLTVRDEALIPPIRGCLGRYGIGVSPDDASLVLRGLETLGVRMRHAAEGAAALAWRLSAHPMVRQVLYPPLAHSPGHDLWKRDFAGASGVFGVVFTDAAAPHVLPALDVLRTFAIGASWGGTRSLMAPMPIKRHRTARPWGGADLVLRISVGLEDPSDLLDDVAALLDEVSARTGRAAADA
ncbi:trans-sulfuration enzyme family protein [Azospirillum picis]|uniref:Cystathionine beta-lyase n=1 Tax=Azospirillum picis TaxID=488438 RepID=A0ABU0MN16_9PROT|nr:aminotransferase class I/II-fold pyridoxal phosphate-dependent enzyme [Azospirillum picis]MBP2301182.1 cystathionine beta-lyase [Azospirillum picis]MDQ0534855.1 cystathionine beta-lyase [Azospirillum picis]